MTIRVHVHGAGGRMGSAAVRAIEGDPALRLCGTSGRGDDLAACLEQTRPQVLVEFTVAAAAPQHLRAGLRAGAHVVSGTTGIPDAERTELGRLAGEAGRGLLLAPNFCIGVVLMQRFARAAAACFDDVEILELHHDRKLDAPSGTALHTAEQIAAAAARPLNPDRPPEDERVAGARGGRHRGIPIHAVRLPGLLAHQEILFGGLGQVLTIRHDTLDRQAFMPGVLRAIQRIHRHRGLVDTLEELLDLP